jgi:hypothetical protein
VLRPGIRRAVQLQLPHLSNVKKLLFLTNPAPVFRIRIRIHWSEVWIRILLTSCKNSKKNRDSFYFVTLFDFLSSKDDV